MNSDDESLFEEYIKATKYARWKYKYGIFVLIGCWICLILLIIYVVIYATELSTHPAIYMLDKLNAEECTCYCKGVNYYINKTTISYMENFFSP